MRSRTLAGSIVLLCATVLATGCSSSQVNMDIPPAPDSSSMTAAALLEDPFVKGLDKAYTSAFEGSDFTVNVTLTAADGTVNGYNVMKQEDKYRFVTRLVKTTNTAWMSEGNMSCQRTFLEGESSSTESDAEAEWACSDPGYDFHSPELERLALSSPSAILSASENPDQPLNVVFSSDLAGMTVEFVDASGAPLFTAEWTATEEKVRFSFIYPSGIKMEADISPSVVEDIASIEDFKKKMVPAPLPAPELPAEAPEVTTPSPSPSVTSSTSPADIVAGTPKMRALCTKIVESKMPVEDAIALAEKRGYSARVLTIDGEPQAVSSDLRDDRFNFITADNVVLECMYG